MATDGSLEVDVVQQPGVVLTGVDDAVSFNLFHEGLHFGSVLALRKLVA